MQTVCSPLQRPRAELRRVVRSPRALKATAADVENCRASKNAIRLSTTPSLGVGAVEDTPFCDARTDRNGPGANATIIYQNDPQRTCAAKYEIARGRRVGVRRIVRLRASRREVVHQARRSFAKNIEDTRLALRSKPMERVGCLSGGPADIRKHVFFQKDDFDWGKLLRLELPPPYVPKIKSETDVSNFDRIESKVDFFAGEPYDFSDARQWDVDF